MGETANQGGTIHRVNGPASLLVGSIGRFIRGWQDTLHYENTGPIHRLMHGDLPGHLVLLWHNRLFACIGAMMNSGPTSRRLYALVSASRDGAQLVHYLEAQGIHPVRGSSSRRGAVATREVLKILEDGHHVAITVDGPRGPCYRAQPGAALMTQLTGAPLAFLGAECESAWELGSWDRFIVPKPFSRVRVVMDLLESPEVKGGREGRLALQEMFQNRMLGITCDSHRRH
jgi:lysophospholipid acyltransferase (LPLAT)-like uncharacterized protein